MRKTSGRLNNKTMLDYPYETVYTNLQYILQSGESPIWVPNLNSIGHDQRQDEETELRGD